MFCSRNHSKILTACSLWLAVSTLLACTPLTSATHAQGMSDDTKFALQIDLSQFRETTIGSKLVDYTHRLASEQIDEEEGELMAKLEESLGFNPFDEVRTLTILGNSYESPDENPENLRAIVRLGKTTGNLEGLMLAVPGYDSEEVDGVEIHSINMDDVSLFVAIHEDRRDNKTLVACTSQAQVLHVLETLDCRQITEGNET